MEYYNSSYRLSYSNEFFEYLFNNPDQKNLYLLSIVNNNRMIGYVFAKKHIISLKNQIKPIVRVNFLCLDKSNTNKRLAPLMIEEITTIANLSEIYHAIFTTHKDYGFSICTASNEEIDSNHTIKTCYLHYWTGSDRIIEDTIEFCKSINIDMINILNNGNNSGIINTFKCL